MDDCATVSGEKPVQSTEESVGNSSSSAVRPKNLFIMPRVDFGISPALHQHLQHRKQQQQQQQQRKKKSRVSGVERTATSYKSCTFCAKRKRRCDGNGSSRCSLCIKKNQECVYRPKTKSEPLGPQRPKSEHAESKAPQLVGPLQTHSGDGSVEMGTGMVRANMLSLKRCRMSPSPATGFLGLQENGFLNDFFGCLGFLPLATESTIRQAMVGIMLDTTLQHERRHHQVQPDLGEDNALARNAGRVVERTREGVRRAATGNRTSSESSSTCLMWCAIALGALVRGAPNEYVSGYIRLARVSLGACFDEETVEATRACLMMSFSHGVLGDQEKNDVYIRLAMRMARGMPRQVVLKELGSTLLVADSSKLYQDTSVPSQDLEEYCADVVDTHLRENKVFKNVESTDNPIYSSEGHGRYHQGQRAAVDLLHVDDIRDMFLLNDHRQRTAFLEDMSAIGAPPFHKPRDLGRGENIDVRPDLEEFVEKTGEDCEVGESGDGRQYDDDDVGDQEGSAGSAWAEGHHASRLFIVSKETEALRHVEPPTAGDSTKSFVREVMPSYARLAESVKRAGLLSGVGGLLYHGNVGYMNAIMGRYEAAMEAMQSCADIIIRYPGVCRFRSHLVHCTLEGAARFGCVTLYESLSVVYNSAKPEGFLRAPPLEEWTGMECVCNHIFCRSVQVEIRHPPSSTQPSSTQPSSSAGASPPVVASQGNDAKKDCTSRERMPFPDPPFANPAQPGVQSMPPPSSSLPLLPQVHFDTHEMVDPMPSSPLSSEPVNVCAGTAGEAVQPDLAVSTWAAEASRPGPAATRTRPVLIQSTMLGGSSVSPWLPPGEERRGDGPHHVEGMLLAQDEHARTWESVRTEGTISSNSDNFPACSDGRGLETDASGGVTLRQAFLTMSSQAVLSAAMDPRTALSGATAASGSGDDNGRGDSDDAGGVARHTRDRRCIPIEETASAHADENDHGACSPAVETSGGVEAVAFDISPLHLDCLRVQQGDESEVYVSDADMLAAAKLLASDDL